MIQLLVRIVIQLLVRIVFSQALPCACRFSTETQQATSHSLNLPGKDLSQIFLKSRWWWGGTVCVCAYYK